MNRQGDYNRVFKTIDELLVKKAGVVVAIDGKCGSGKTTLAAVLDQNYDCNVIHMDDFFLPPDLRTKERLAEPGGNVHYERFQEEVLTGISSGQAFRHRFFDCSQMAFTVWKEFEPKPLTVIEGSYSHRPEFTPYYDLKIFLTLEEAVQKERILSRSGPEKYQQFIKRWIPMEERYFEALSVEDASDLVLRTDENPLPL